jgi:hypothetical protein
MSNLLGFSLFALGVILLIVGFNVTQAYVGEISQAISTNPHREAIWLVLCGGLAVVFGLVLVFQSRRNSR